MITAVSKISALVLVAGVLNAGEYWSRFRGPNGTGVILGGLPPTKLDVEENLVWKIPVGMGHSSPVIWGEQIFLTSFRDGKVFTQAIQRKDGTSNWSHGRLNNGPEKGPGFSDLHEDTNPAAITPCVDAERVYSYSLGTGLVCYDHLGNLLWEKDFPKTDFLYGTASSPIVHKGTLYVLRDSLNSANSMLYALDGKTGAVKWQTPRPFSKISHSTPSILPTSEGFEIVTLGTGRLCGYSPETGEELWALAGMGKSSINVPVISDSDIFVNAKIMLGFNVEYDHEKAWQYILTFDKNKSGQIEGDEIVAGIRMPQRPNLPTSSAGFGYSLNRPEDFKSKFDHDNDDVITFEEFVAAIDSTTKKMEATQGRVRIVRQEGSDPVPELLWSERRFLPEIPSIIPYQGRVYAVLNGGFFVSRNAETGRLIEKDRLSSSGMYAASPVAAEGYIYFVSQRGVVTVMKTDDSFDVVSAQQLDGNIYATPAIQDKFLYLRTSKWLYAFKNNS